MYDIYHNNCDLIFHKCEQNGCGTVLVIDGNMKNAQTVCSVKNVGQIIFEGIGSVTVDKYNNLIKDLINRNNSALRYLKHKAIGW